MQLRFDNDHPLSTPGAAEERAPPSAISRVPPAPKSSFAFSPEFQGLVKGAQTVAYCRQCAAIKQTSFSSSSFPAFASTSVASTNLSSAPILCFKFLYLLLVTACLLPFICAAEASCCYCLLTSCLIILPAYSLSDLSTCCFGQLSKKGSIIATTKYRPPFVLFAWLLQYTLQTCIRQTILRPYSQVYIQLIHSASAATVFVNTHPLNYI
ncbi:hypothetical protein BX070DRAFT_44132 [Coemansia spiralis]|nr:hypothetical protein BX070DRAFT_44132 [Coemansia spiralis]